MLFLSHSPEIGYPGGGILACLILLKVFDHVPHDIKGHRDTHKGLHLDTCACLCPNKASGLNRVFKDFEGNPYRVQWYLMAVRDQEMSLLCGIHGSYFCHRKGVPFLYLIIPYLSDRIGIDDRNFFRIVAQSSLAPAESLLAI